MKCCILFLAAVGSASAFVSNPAGRQSTELFGGADKYATSLKGKMERVETVKTLLDEAQLVFAIPGGSFTVKQTQMLRRSLPEGTTMSTIKNTLMSRAVVGSEYEPISDLLKGANNWFFINEDIGGTIKVYNDFLKTAQKRETHPIRGGVFEGGLYDGDGIDQISKLPTKLELYARIAGSIKQVPTKVAIVIKAPNSKLARAIKLATMPEDKD
jgi:large subunit ribosomal protein L10